MKEKLDNRFRMYPETTVDEIVDLLSEYHNEPVFADYMEYLMCDAPPGYVYNCDGGPVRRASYILSDNVASAFHSFYNTLGTEASFLAFVECLYNTLDNFAYEFQNVKPIRYNDLSEVKVTKELSKKLRHYGLNRPRAWICRYSFPNYIYLLPNHTQPAKIILLDENFNSLSEGYPCVYKGYVID